MTPLSSESTHGYFVKNDHRKILGYTADSNKGVKGNAAEFYFLIYLILGQ